MQNIEYYKKDQFLPGNVRDLVVTDIKLNSLNYRAPEFSNINWSESVVIFGCSNVFGVGLNDDETIPYHLEKLLKRPVVNMGVPGSSIAYSVFNQTVLAESNHSPYAVINLWTSINRITYFYEDGPCHIGPWTARYANNNIVIRSIKSVFDAWNVNDSNPLMHSIMLQKLSEIIWKDTKHFQGTFFPNTSDALNVELFHCKDNASDNYHPGPLTAKEVAEQLAVWCR
jgi:hypothetical protein